MPFAASYELDLFGRVRRTLEAANASLQASAADLENTRLVLTAELAADYAALAEGVGLDLARFHECMRAPATGRRVQQDIAAAITALVFGAGTFALSVVVFFLRGVFALAATASARPRRSSRASMSKRR